MRRCVVCTQIAKTWMCGACQASFDRLRELDDGTMLSVIKWAAERARARLACAMPKQTPSKPRREVAAALAKPEGET